ncbi:choice-of-anchor J domain-containing protein [Pontibacter sp. KCTC 32443]|uniref:T9SS-dependent choice-of-anchor J family protein n=1 Tax=Pontibacter TaxID=323449 RepID=UPI00164D0AE8|nr:MULTISPECIES: choice-of-anchor J domain-containing protein [Pontibacter]MBC5775417.1 choice-of-anchor J domain-containing protein [Pontibacter sp. KCTC 32443]
MSKHLQKLFALVLICCAFLGSSNAWGQTNPAAQNLPFSTDFSSMQSTIVLPNGISVWTVAAKATKADAEASIPSGDAIIKVVSTVQTSSSNAYNYNKDGNNRIYIQPTANTTSGNNQIAAAINTTGKTGISIAYDIELINNQTRSVGVILQYRIGESGNWTTINSADYTTVNRPAGDVQSITASLPAEVENQPIVQIRWATYEYVVEGAGGSRDGIALDNIVIKDGEASQPPLTASVSALNFGSLAQNAQGSVLSYVLTANQLSSDLKIVTGGPFSISKVENETFTQEITFTAAELVTPQKVYVKVSTTTAGTFANSIVHSAEGIADVSVTASADVYSPYVQNFTNCTGNESLTGGWVQFSVTGAQTWACTTFGQQGNGVQMSGFANNVNNANEDWLISPKLDLTAYAFPLVSVNYRTKYAGDALSVMVSTNYSGTGNPAIATWTNLITLPADNADIWKLLENLDLNSYKSANTYIAFVYTSTADSPASAGSAARWTLDNFEVKDASNYLNTSNLNLNFAETAQGSTSAAQEFTFSAVGFAADVIVTAPANFELSKDGTEYTSSLTYTSAEAAASNKVYVRFAPATTSFISSGPITFTSGSEAPITRGMLTGSSMLKANTLEVVTWNMEWFGSTGSGPSDDALQYENVKKVITELNADIIGVQEVVDEAKIAQLAQEIGYAYVSETMSWQASNEQKVGFLYKLSTVTVKKEKVLLAKLFSDIKNNGVTLQDYPNNRSDLFWSSGRLPYMVEFEANIDGKKQRVHVVNIHAKANEDTDIFPYNRRKYDVKVLKDSLDVQYPNANLVLLGDYNDDVDVSVVGTNPSSFEVFVTDTEDYKTLTYDLSLAGKNTYESGSFKSFLDHLIISKEFEDEYVPGSIAIEEQLLNSITNFRNTTSDHLPVSARFILTATATPASVTFTSPSISKAEDAGSFTVSVTLSEGVGTEQTVTITPATSSTATVADYTLTGANNGAVTVTIPANSTTATFEVNITDDTETEDAEQVVFNITGASNGLEIGTAKTFTLTIEGNDAPTGIADGTKGQFSIYPNPVNSDVRFLLPERVAATAKVKMIVYSAEGRKVMNIAGTQDAVQAQLSSRVANLPAGIYMILIETGKEFFQTKMVKN